MTKSTEIIAPPITLALSQPSTQLIQPKYKLPVYITPDEAQKIFRHGQKRFFSADMIAEAFNRYRHPAFEMLPLAPPSQTSPPCRGLIPFTARTLRGRAKNKNQRWLLGYSYGLSISELYLMFGHHHKESPSFCPCKRCSIYYSRWLNRNWSEQRGEAGYYLLDLEPRFTGFDYQEQNRRIVEELGVCFERAPLSLLVEAWFAAQLITGENLFKLFHWGAGLYPVGRVAMANNEARPGQHKKNSLLVFAINQNNGFSDLGVHVTKRPEIKVISSA